MYDQLVSKRQRGKRGMELDKSGDVQAWLLTGAIFFIWLRFLFGPFAPKV